MITDRRKLTTKIISVRDVKFPSSPLESIQSHSPGLYSPYTENTPPKTLVYDVHTTRLHGMLHNAERCKYAWPDDVIQQFKVD